jgi:hypothetical protein
VGGAAFAEANIAMMQQATSGHLVAANELSCFSTLKGFIEKF